MKVIGAFFRFIFFLALLGAVGYNTYEVMQLRADVEQLKTASQAPGPTLERATGHAPLSPKVARSPKSAHGKIAAGKMAVAENTEPDTENPRQKIGGSEGTDDGPMGVLQKTGSDIQTNSQRTIAALQQRIADLTQQMEGQKPQSDSNDDTPPLRKIRTGKKAE